MVKRSIAFKVYLTPEENERLQARVDAAQLSRSQYGHLVLTSPFAEALQQAQEQREDKRALCLLLAKQHVTLSLLEANLARLLEGDPGDGGNEDVETVGLQTLLHQLQGELKQVHTEVGRLHRWLRSDIVGGE